MATNLKRSNGMHLVLSKKYRKKAGVEWNDTKRKKYYDLESYHTAVRHQQISRNRILTKAERKEMYDRRVNSKF